MRLLPLFLLVLGGFAYIEGLQIKYHETTSSRMILWLGPLTESFVEIEGDVTMVGVYDGRTHSKYNRATFSVDTIEEVRYIKVESPGTVWYDAPLCEDGSLYYSSASLQFYLETIPGTRLTNAMPFTSEHCGTSLPPGVEPDPDPESSLKLMYYDVYGDSMILWMGPTTRPLSVSTGRLMIGGSVFDSPAHDANYATFGVDEVDGEMFIRVKVDNPQWNDFPLCAVGALVYPTASIQMRLGTAAEYPLTNPMPFTVENCGSKPPPGIVVDHSDICNLEVKYYDHFGDTMTLWLGPYYRNFDVGVAEGDITLFGHVEGDKDREFNRATFTSVVIEDRPYLKVATDVHTWNYAELCDGGSLTYPTASLFLYLETIPGTRLTNAMPFPNEFCTRSPPPGYDPDPESFAEKALPVILLFIIVVLVIVVVVLFRMRPKKSPEAEPSAARLETGTAPTDNESEEAPPKKKEPQDSSEKSVQDDTPQTQSLDNSIQGSAQAGHVVYLQPGDQLPSGLVVVGHYPPSQPASGQTIQPMSVNGVPTGQAVHNQYVPHPAQPMTAPVQVPSEISTHSYVQPMIIQAEPTGASPQQMNVLQQSVVQPMVPSFEGDSGML